MNEIKRIKKFGIWIQFTSLQKEKDSTDTKVCSGSF
jgi:hypothetical protein